MENRKKVLDSQIDSALKEVALEYIQKLQPELLTKVKNDFAKSKAFQVSQTLVGGSKSPDYESQLNKFRDKAGGERNNSDLKDEQKQAD